VTASAASDAPARRQLLGTTVHAVGADDALRWICDRIASREAGYIVTLNGAMLVQTARDPAFREIVNGAGLVTADGIGVILAARILGVRGIQRLAGIDLATGACAQAASLGHRLYLLGAAPGVADAAAAALRARFPGVRIVGVRHGFFTVDEEPALVDEIRRAGPDIVLVALGAPRQEQWMRRWMPRLGAPVAIGVGGSLDVLAGRVRRAPLWMRRLGLEWLFRALLEPRRWSVVRTIPPLFLLALRERWRRGDRSRPRGDSNECR
jgi:N-acetylglucosaminyldiphosphoundecaprenol N-acetyl-beta-D-mannosaminyltransferase